MPREDRFTSFRRLGYSGTLAEMQSAWAKDTSRSDPDVDKGSILYDVTDYGGRGTYTGSSGSDDTAAIFRALDDMQANGSAGTLYFPPRLNGLGYRCTSPLPNISGLRIYGPSRKACKLYFVGCNGFDITSGTLSDLILEGVFIRSTGGHLFSLTGSGTLTFSAIRDCELYPSSTDKSILYQNGSGDFLENTWENLVCHRQAASTVPFFDVANSAGGANGNVWKRLRLNSNNCVGAPAIRIDSTVTGSYTYGNSFEDIVGEQNPAGLIHMLSSNTTYLKNCQDWDATVDYVDSVIKFDKSANSTTESRNMCVIDSGRFGGTLGVGTYDVYASTNSRGLVCITSGNHTTTPVINLPSRGGFHLTDRGLFTATGDILQTGRNTTANRPLASTAGVGAMFYDTTLSKPIWSDGTVWRDAAGTSV